MKGNEFFGSFFAQFLIGSQTNSPLHSYRTLSPKGSLPLSQDASLLAQLTLKVIAQHEILATGMYRFLSKVKWENLTTSANVVEFLHWGSDAMKEIIREGLDL